MSNISKFFIYFIVAIAVLTGFIGFLLAYMPSRMSEQHTNEIVELYFQDAGYSVDSFNSTWASKMEQYNLVSEQGHTIPVFYICSNEDYNNKTIILIHWHESNHIAMYPIAEDFLEQGWNVALYDQRAHGKNTAKTVTFGYLESLDLQQVVDFIFEKSNGATIGALGQSMGAATLAYYSGTEHASQHLDFAVIDSSFSGMYDEIYWEVSKAKFPLPAKALTTLGSGFCKLIYNYSFSDVDIVEQIGSSSIPTLILHNKSDQKCPFYMGQELFEAIPHSKKEFVTFEDSDHLFSYWDETGRYMNEVSSFIDQYVMRGKEQPSTNFSFPHRVLSSIMEP
ncbi:MAG: alpha/beta hydrolase [Syntrophomonas sp.]